MTQTTLDDRTLTAQSGDMSCAVKHTLTNIEMINVKACGLVPICGTYRRCEFDSYELNSDKNGNTDSIVFLGASLKRFDRRRQSEAMKKAEKQISNVLRF